jgi:hypothetical protein
MAMDSVVGVLLIVFGLLAIFFSSAFSRIQTKVNTRLWNPWGESPPRVLVWFGFGLVILGTAIIFGLV